MGGKGGSSTPNFPAPQPINTQQLINQQAKANRVDVRSPGGSAIFSGPQRRELDITLSPEQQQLFEQQQQAGLLAGQGALGLLGGFDPTGFNLEGLPELPGVGDFGAERDRVEQATFDRALGLLSPQFEQQSEALESNLAARGIPLGSELRGRELGNLNEAFGRSLAQAASDAVLAGGAEQNRLFGLSQAARQQGLSERLTERSQPLSEIAALLGQQTVQQPTVFGPAPVDVVGPAQLASNQALGLFGIGQQANQAASNRDAALANALIGTGGNLAAFGLFG